MITQRNSLKIKNKKNWINVLDQQTGLVGWVLEEDFSESKPAKKIKSKNYEKTFSNFKSRVLEMSKSIKEAIAVDTFLDVKHLGGAAAYGDSWMILGLREEDTAQPSISSL